MAALAWLLIPVAAILLGVVWSAWATRQRGRVEDAAGVAGYQRFREAMERTRDEPGAPQTRPATAASASSDGTARTAD